jgi:hypothetical protein
MTVTAMEVTFRYRPQLRPVASQDCFFSAPVGDVGPARTKNP